MCGFISFVLLALVAGAGAQDQPKENEKPEVSLLADFGLGGKMASGKFAPVRVWVQAADENLSGMLEVEIVGANGAPWRSVSPVEAAAGALVSVPIVAPMPEWCERLTLTLRSGSGGRLARTEYSPLPGSTTIQLPTLLAPNQEILVSLTPRVSGVRVAEKFVASTLEPLVREPLPGKPIGTETGVDLLGRSMERFELLSRMVGANMAPDAMPMSEWAYEGALAVIADGAAVREADPRALHALTRWVLGGGRLVILADQPGAAWRELLPPGVPVDAIELAPPREMASPRAIRAALGGRGFERVSARPVRLTLAAEELGWRERWGGEEGALIAEGPVGLGWVTLVTVHPDFVGAADESWKLWQDALTPAMDLVQTQPGEARTMHNGPGWRYQMSLGRALPGTVFDAIGRATSVGPAAIALVAIVTASLAIMLGPGDYFLLRALRRRQLAWVSALVWIGMASVAAVIVPGRLRAGPSTASRLTVIEATLPNAAIAGDHPSQRAITLIPPALRGQRIGLTHLYAGSGEAFRFDSGGVWFEYTPWAFENTVTLRALTVMQGPGGAGLGDVRSAAPARVDAGQWSVRTLIDQSPVDPGLVVSLERGEGGWELKIEGLGAGARILSGHLQIGKDFYHLGERYQTTLHSEAAELVFADEFLAGGPRREWSDPVEIHPNRPYMQKWMDADTLGELMPSALLALPGAEERGRVARAYAETGGFAVVSLFVTEQAMDIGIETSEIERTRASVYRLVVPVEGGAGRD